MRDPQSRDDDHHRLEKAVNNSSYERFRRTHPHEFALSEEEWLHLRQSSSDASVAADHPIPPPERTPLSSEEQPPVAKKPWLSGIKRRNKQQRKGIDSQLDRPGRRPSLLDYEADPLLRLEENHTSIRNAIIFVIAIPLLTVITGGIIAFISRAHGGPLCDSGYSSWFCTRTFEILFPVIPGIISFGGLIIAGVITWRQWANDRSWTPWLAIVWVLLPFSLLWATGVGAIAIVGQHTPPPVP